MPGDPVNSLLIQAINHSDTLKMPPKKHLTQEQIAEKVGKEIFAVLSSKQRDKWDSMQGKKFTFKPPMPPQQGGRPGGPGGPGGGG